MGRATTPARGFPLLLSRAAHECCNSQTAAYMLRSAHD